MTCGVVVQPEVMTEILTTVLLRMMWVLLESVVNVKYSRKTVASGSFELGAYFMQFNICCKYARKYCCIT